MITLYKYIPIIAPIAPQLTASSAFMLKKGGYKIAAGKTISLSDG